MYQGLSNDEKLEQALQNKQSATKDTQVGNKTIIDKGHTSVVVAEALLK